MRLWTQVECVSPLWGACQGSPGSPALVRSTPAQLGLALTLSAICPGCPGPPPRGLPDGDTAQARQRGPRGTGRTGRSRRASSGVCGQPDGRWVLARPGRVRLSMAAPLTPGWQKTPEPPLCGRRPDPTGHPAEQTKPGGRQCVKRSYFVSPLSLLSLFRDSHARPAARLQNSPSEAVSQSARGGAAAGTAPRVQGSPRGHGARAAPPAGPPRDPGRNRASPPPRISKFT